MLKVGQKGDYEVYEMAPCSVVDAVEGVQSEIISHYDKDSDSMFADAEDDDTSKAVPS